MLLNLKYLLFIYAFDAILEKYQMKYKSKMKNNIAIMVAIGITYCCEKLSLFSNSII
jgi:hypothetical protein